MINEERLLMNISKWLNEFIKQNSIDIKEMEKELECTSGFLETLLKYKDNPLKYNLKNGISIQFIAKIKQKYNAPLDEIFNED